MFQHAMDRRIFLAIGLLLAWATTALATDADAPVQLSSNDCGAARAGYPDAISCRARPSNGPGDTGYYVGGGAAFHGQPRMVTEGTWGWDYAGVFCFRRIELGWWHGARYQGGPGQYQPDGPKPLHH